MRPAPTVVPRSMRRYPRIVGPMTAFLSARPANWATRGPWARSDRVVEYLDQHDETRPPVPALELVRPRQLFPESSRPRRQALSAREAFPVRHEPTRQAAAKERVGLRNFRPTRVPEGVGWGSSPVRFERTKSVGNGRAGLRTPSPLKSPLQTRTPRPGLPPGPPEEAAPRELRPKWVSHPSRTPSEWTRSKRLHR